jgi:tetratricopeptide (TPR) repeat protein
MFNNKDASFEIAQSMEKALVANAVDKQTEGLDKLAQAMEHLNAAAEIFDDAGLRKHAEAATQLLESLAAKKSKSKSKPSKSSKKSKPAKSSKKSKPARRKSKKQDAKDSSMEGLTSDKMLSNLEHKGWVFNADDGADESYADDNFAHHGDDCMCSMCMDADDMNYLRHGDDCMCSMCMDADDDNYNHHGDDCMCSMCMDVDDVNDMKLGVAGPGMGFHSETPERYRSLARHYTERNEFRKAEEAMKRALELEELDRYDTEEADDFNFDFDTSKDSGYHVHRDPEEGYHLNAMDDFEDEVELFPHRRF